MPRSPDGTYTPPLPNVNPGEVVSSAWANTTIADISQALTDSLDRNGNGGMNAPFRFADGSEVAPGIAWISETSTGLYRAGVGDMRVSILGTDLFRWFNNTVQQWDGAEWVQIALIGQSGTVPDGGAIGDVPFWDGTKYVSGALEAEYVGFVAGTNNYVIGPTVQDALDQIDPLVSQSQSHISNQDIHFPDAPTGAGAYGRGNQSWVSVITWNGDPADTPIINIDSPSNNEALLYDDVSGEWKNAGLPGGITDHGALTGLADDDHPQYLNETRGDARYPLIGTPADDSTLWDGYALVVTSTDPGVYDPATIYFITN